MWIYQWHCKYNISLLSETSTSLQRIFNSRLSTIYTKVKDVALWYLAVMFNQEFSWAKCYLRKATLWSKFNIIIRGWVNWPIIHLSLTIYKIVSTISLHATFVTYGLFSLYRETTLQMSILPLVYLPKIPMIQF